VGVKLVVGVRYDAGPDLHTGSFLIGFWLGCQGELRAIVVKFEYDYLVKDRDLCDYNDMSCVGIYLWFLL
jgi:hypothetical protein